MTKKIFLNSLARAVSILLLVATVFTVASFGFFAGYKKGSNDQYLADINTFGEATETTSTVVYVTTTPQPTAFSVPAKPTISWGGPDLWEAVNVARVQHGVGQLAQRDELCTIASIRLNELLELGKLDGHEGFSNMPERRPDLKWIFEKYGQVAEFLVSGATTAQEAVDLWLNTLGHKKLITGGEYTYGCIYGQGGFGVAIAAF